MNSNSTHQGPLRLPLLVIGFCVDMAGEAKLQAAGVERIWRRGNGLESLDDAIFEFRGRAGALAVVGDLRIFGETNYEISVICAELFRLGIALVDIEHPEQVVPELQERARKALHASKPMPSHRIARRRGRLGGLAKASAAALLRAGIVSEAIARRLCQSRLTWKEKSFILGMPVSTIQRHYGVQT